MRMTRGVGTNTIYLVSRWVSGTSLIVAAEAMVKIGVLAGIAYAVVGVCAFLLFGLLFKYFYKNYRIDSSNKGDLVYKSTLFSKGNNGIHFLIFLVNALTLYIKILVGAIVLFSLTGIPVPYAFVFYALAGYLVLQFDFKWVSNYKVYPVALLQVTMILLLVYLFFLNGVQHVFDGIQLYHPYLLVYKNTDIFKFMISSFIVIFIHLLFDPITGTYLYKNRERGWSLSIVLSSLVWSTMPIAFSTLMLAIIYTGGFKDFTSLMYKLNHLGGHNVLALFFTIFLSITIFSTFIGELKYFIGYMDQYILGEGIQNKPVKWIKESVVFLVFLLVSSSITLTFHSSILTTLYFTSIYFVSLGIPVLFFLLTKSRDNGSVLLITTITTIIGYTLYGNKDYAISLISVIVVGFFLSALLIRKLTETEYFN